MQAEQKISINVNINTGSVYQALLKEDSKDLQDLLLSKIQLLDLLPADHEFFAEISQNLSHVMCQKVLKNIIELYDKDKAKDKTAASFTH